MLSESVKVEPLALPAWKLERLESVARWVVFTDLHVHARFAPSWRLALEAVHALAVEHDAGVLFLVRVRAIRLARGACSDARWQHTRAA